MKLMEIEINGNGNCNYGKEQLKDSQKISN